MTPQGSSSPRDALASLISLLPRVVRSAWLGGVVFALGLAGTAVWALSTRRIYQSESVILFERGVQSVTNMDGESANQVFMRLQDLVVARRRLEPIIKQMNLYPAMVDQRGILGALEEMRKDIKISGSGWYSYRISYNSDSRDVAQAVLARMVKEVVAEDSQRRKKEADDG